MSLRNLQITSAITSNLGNVVYQDITDSLPKNPKNTWAQLAGVRALEELTTIVLHHDAYPKKNTINYSDIQLMTKIATDHINNKAYDVTGEGGIPYHIFIRNGRIYQLNDLQDRTYGVASNNGYTVHIVVSGDYFNYDVLTDADRNALYAAILMVIDVLPKYKEIKAHKELNATDCPGYDHIKVRSDIKNIQMKIQRDNTVAAKRERGFSVANQAAYMYDKSKQDDGDGAWAQHWLDEVYGIMKDKGLL
ncbi:peptidoglycan recognition protein family protein [Paenibacillus sp. HWE-109]|uniref:peptidoglycan recognition protein family protein n=1 Tax=Paenibacillus sp. HWE-109 TaxID=1306526 RepID=UPI001EDD694F|nr:peptidoglycan recognition family protein [Paenibacillus sp. HWE-109]UKS25013.1 peptidoglycan recognition protein family protein [Paenibacillus sp. HWE-109]